MTTLLVSMLTPVLVPTLALAGTAAPRVSWQTELDGAQSSDDHAYGVAVDAAGDVVAAGDMVNRGFDTDFAVVKVDGAAGAAIWKVSLEGTGGGFGSAAQDVAIDPGGNPVAVGYLDNRNTNQDFAVVELDGATGAVEWRTELSGTGLGGTDQALAVAIDGSGHVYAGGFVDNSIVFHTFIVVKLDGATGDVLWRRELNGSGSLYRTQVNSLVLDGAGDVVAAGSVVNAGQAEDFAVVKLDGATGTVEWRTELDGTGHYQDEAYDVVLGADGSILTAGFIYGAATFHDFAVVKLDPVAGGVTWQTTIDGRASWADGATSLAVDSRGDVVAGGRLYNRNDVWADFSVIGIDGDTGSVRWQRDLAGDASSDVDAVEIDGQDRAVVSGALFRTATKTDFTVAFFDAATGRRRALVNLNGTDDWFDAASDIALGADGRVIAAGSLINSATGSDLAVVRLR
jgi:PQQ-like domain